MSSSEEIFLRPSKSQRKRDMRRLQALGARLAGLPPRELGALPVDGEMLEALQQARNLSRRAYQRHVRYLGKLLSRLDETTLRAVSDAAQSSGGSDADRFHALEGWRERLLTEGEAGLEALNTRYPGADLGYIRRLVQDIARERAAGAAPRAYRRLFKYLRSLDDAGNMP